MSLERVRAFKTRAIAVVTEVGATLCTVTPLRFDQAQSVVATATAMAGAMWQMAAPGTELRDFYEHADLAMCRLGGTVEIAELRGGPASRTRDPAGSTRG